MNQIATSKNGVPIRLTDERWEHITNHPEMVRKRNLVLQAVTNPEKVMSGSHENELLAIKRLRNGSWIVVVYKEVHSKDGFIITAWISNSKAGLDSKPQIWP